MVVPSRTWRIGKAAGTPFGSTNGWTGTMQVQYETSLDELVRVTVRVLARSKTVRSWERLNYLAGTAISALLTFVIFYLLLPDSLEIRLAAGVGGALGCVLLFPSINRRIRDRRLRQYYQEHLGGTGPFPVQVELTPEGVSCKQSTAQVMLEWSQIETIQDSADCIEFIARHGGEIVVWKRAFESEDANRQFVQEAHRLLSQSWQSSEK